MDDKYLNFMMKLQESLHYHSLPSDKSLHRDARKKTVADLSRAVSQMVLHLKPEVVMEIGAHGAEFSQSIKSNLAASRVIAFEANPIVHEKFRRQVEASGVEYLFKCIADENRNYKFSVPGAETEQSTMGSVLNYKPMDTYATYEVPGHRLDDFFDGNIRSNAMWVDVEGAIGAVLSGAENSLKNCVLFYAELEATARWEGQILDGDVIAKLASYGLFPVLRDIQRHKWQHNVLFLRSSALSDPAILKICSDFLKATVGHVRKETSRATKAAAAAAIALIPM